MRSRPALPDEVLAAALRRGWGLDGATVSFLPEGYDPRAWAFAAGQLFVKVRRDAFARVALELPPYLRSVGLDPVVAPVPALSGALAVPVGDYWVAVYPFVSASQVVSVGLADAGWVAYGAFLGALHRVTPPPSLAALLPVEAFDAAPAVRMRTLAPRALATDGPLAATWRARSREIAALCARLEDSGAGLRGRRLDRVVCHTDAHGGNVLVDAAGALHVVDWDAPMFAPAERDLVLIVGRRSGWAAVTARQEALFMRGYGERPVDGAALEYYRCHRVLEDLAEFAESILSPDSSQETRRTDLQWFDAQFAGVGGVR